MKKYAGYIALGLIALAGIVVVVYFGLQPRAIPKIKISTFENETVAANAALLRLRQEFLNSPILIVGIEPNKPELTQIFLTFLSMNSDPETAYRAFFVDQDLEKMIPELRTVPGERIDVKNDFTRFEQGIRNALEQKIRTVVIVPPPYAASFLGGSPAGLLKEHQISTMNLLLMDFPRRREDEKKMWLPCDVAEHDQNGTGRLGCEVVSNSRLVYRKSFPKDSLVGLLNQVSGNDFLYLMTRQP